MKVLAPHFALEQCHVMGMCCSIRTNPLIFVEKEWSINELVFAFTPLKKMLLVNFICCFILTFLSYSFLAFLGLLLLPLRPNTTWCAPCVYIGTPRDCMSVNVVLPDEDYGIVRVRNALNAHMWPHMKLRAGDSKETKIPAKDKVSLCTVFQRGKPLL